MPVAILRLRYTNPENGLIKVIPSQSPGSIAHTTPRSVTRRLLSGVAQEPHAQSHPGLHNDRRRSSYAVNREAGRGP